MITPREGSFEEPHETHLDDAANDCSHLALRPHAAAGGYACDTCRRDLRTMETEQASSEATLRVVREVSWPGGVSSCGTAG